MRNPLTLAEADSCYEAHRIVSGSWSENCYVVVSRASRGGVIIDPGSDVESIWSTVEQKNVTVSGILLTHAHYDHMDGVVPIRERTRAAVYVHEDDVVLLGNANVFALAWRLPLVKIPRVDVRLRGGEKLTFADIGVTVLHLPGHTKGSVAYAIGHMFFVGDTILPRTVGRVDLPGGDENALGMSIRTAISWATEQTTLCPGHGDPMDLAGLLKSNAAVRRCLEGSPREVTTEAASGTERE